MLTRYIFAVANLLVLLLICVRHFVSAVHLYVRISDHGARFTKDLS